MTTATHKLCVSISIMLSQLSTRITLNINCSDIVQKGKQGKCNAHYECIKSRL